MATIYRAELSPTKPEALERWLDRQFWGGSGPIEIIDSYRFDDAEGQVGFEGFLIQRGELTLHVPVTYRGAPLEGAEDYLITTMEHSVLDERWVYDAMADPVAVHILNQALAGEVQQAELYIYGADGQYIATDPNTTTILVQGERPEQWGQVAVHHVLSDQHDDVQSRRLVATWETGSGVIFELLDDEEDAGSTTSTENPA